jgi:hypothetical protein
MRHFISLQVIKTVAVGVFMLVAVSQTKAQSYVPEENNGKFKLKPVVEVKAYSFNLADVQLLNIHRST